MTSSRPPSTSLLDQGLDRFPDLLFLVNPEGIILDYCGGRATNLYAPPEAFLGRSLLSVLPMPAATRLGDAVARVSNTHSPAAVDYVLPMPDGERAFEARLIPLLPEAILAVCRDVTETPRPSEQRQAQHRVAEVMRTESLIDSVTAVSAPSNGVPQVSGVATDVTSQRGLLHEFNDALSILIGNAQVAQRLVPDDPSVRESLDRVLAASRTMEGLVRRMHAVAPAAPEDRLAAPDPVTAEPARLLPESSLLTRSESSLEDWRLMLRTRPNVLIEGTAAATEGMLRLLMPRCLEPVVAWSRSLGDTRPATLIVRNVADLPAIEQQHLLQWIADGERVQVLSTSGRPLFPLVAQGRFRDDLYYRLNVLRLDV